MTLTTNRRDQDFVLYEMLGIEELFATEKFKDFSRDTCDMTLDMAYRLGEKEILPRLMESDREGASLVNGEVHVPECLHSLQKIMAEGGWFTVSAPQDAGGQGMPYVIETAVQENFLFHMGYFMYPAGAIGASHLIYEYGTDEQKKKYMDKLFEGKNGGTMLITEPDAGSDVGALKTKAVRQPDGTYKITGQKIFISCGDNDLFENIVHPILARIEGDPAGTSGISIFLMPKFLVNDDGSLGRRNDYTVTGIEHKLGLSANATCAMSFGDNDNCYAELLGQERQGMKIMFNMMNEERINMGLQGLSTGSAAYHHALAYAKDRVQGRSVMSTDPKPVTIINHPDVRRMLMWMKSHVEALRAMVYLCAFAIDRKKSSEGDDAKKWGGIMEFMVPVLKAFGTDTGFRITETAMQVYGGYGYCKDYPVEQFLRDMKIGSIYEGTNGIQSIDLVLRKLSQEGGKNFRYLVAEMYSALDRYSGIGTLTALSDKLRDAVTVLTGTVSYFTECMKGKQLLVPVINSYPFLNLTGNVMSAWLLYWQAGIASEKLAEAAGKEGFAVTDKEKMKQLIEKNKDAAFYNSKILTASFFIYNVLPQALAIKQSIEAGDISAMKLDEEDF
ncbi:MAG TPA: acyl-CoA dehydrogenase [Spirochaetota bacterium]|nr:acyl-CoA dehydrogenase [Spirochaetota bacterium]HPS85277.1 acyl-CoA dehydrogenase [Spirochaetota bacterium]